MSIISKKEDTPTKFTIVDCVFVQDNKIYDIFEGTVTIPQTTKNKYYTFTLVEDSLVSQCGTIRSIVCK